MSTWRASFFFGLSLLVVGCGPATGRGAVGDGGDNGGGNDFATNNQNGDGGSNASDAGPIDNDAFWAADPPPMYCALDGGAFPPPKNPGGTPDCPDDKNREGCPCPTVGMTAACWPGLRVNRNLGDCKDGTTTCVTQGELGQAWGPCVGYVLPVPNSTGKAACHCFSAGKWAIDDLSPCLYNNGTAGATSSEIANNMIMCEQMMGNLVLPTQPWSTNTVTADCSGHFKLCYTLKAGDAMNPSPNDCVLGTSCTEADYVQVGQAQPFPQLPAWVAGDQAGITCATKFATSGYGEMSVDGETVMCDPVKEVFNRVGYCSQACLMNPMMMGCQNCMSGGGGNF